MSARRRPPRATFSFRACAAAQCVAVEAGHRAVIFDLLHDGVLPDVKGEGTHFVIPVIQRLVLASCRFRQSNAPSQAHLLRRALQAAQHRRRHRLQGFACLSKRRSRSVRRRPPDRQHHAAHPLPPGNRLPARDLPRSLRLLHHAHVTPARNSAWTTTSACCRPSATKCSRPLWFVDSDRWACAHGVCQAQFDASELITQREIVSAKCREALNSRAKTFRIVLDDISITHLAFGKVGGCARAGFGHRAQEFTQAVELKQVAQQEAERARFLVEQAEQEKQANIIRAEGDNEARERLCCHTIHPTHRPV